jgi:ATP-binding cassette, subfamily B, bacterial
MRRPADGGQTAPGAGALTSLRVLFSTAIATDRTGLSAGLALLLAASILRPLYPLLFADLVDAAARHEVATGTAVAIALITAVGIACSSYGSMFLWNVWERMTITIDRQLVTMAGRIGLIDDVERPQYLDHLTLVRRNRETFQESMMALLASLGLLLQIAITVVILLSVAPVLLVLPLLAVAPVIASRWAERRTQQTMERTAPEARVADSFMSLAMDAGKGGELRVLRLRDYAVRRHREAWGSTLREQFRADSIGAAVSAAALIVFTIGFAGALLYVTDRSLHGGTSLGDVILVLTAGQQLHTQVGGAASTSGALFRILETMRHYSWIARYAAAREPRGELAAARRLAAGIELERVSFRYQQSGRDAVSDVSLTLPAGSVVALVGENGAGKSTLVSLICGLHRPTTGRILVDGGDLAMLELTSWRSSLTAAFQDFVRYQVLARESVGVGDIERIDDPDAVRRALARADVADVEHDLPDGLETPLGRAFLRGIDLSGGQWQKVALARSMMRDAPLVLVLDEPTYSLDVESERRVFDWFARVAATDNPIGTVTIIVSHRFSTVRSADVVAVLHEGRLVEVGSHDELLAVGGRYADMYRTQAEGYR